MADYEGVIEFVWTAEDFENLLFDQEAEDRDCAFEEIVQSQDFNVWKYLDDWRNKSPYPEEEEEL